MKKRYLVIFLFLPLLASCVKSRIMKQPGMIFEPTDSSKIEIFYLEPEKTYIKIGVVETSGAPLSSWKKAERYMRKEASKIGGHAVIITEKDRPARQITDQGYILRKKNLSGIVIRWK